MMSVKISIIMPVYNKEKYVSKSIESVLNSEFDEYELICIDDGSTDNSVNILKEYAARNTDIKIYCNELNMGVSATRNKGLDVAEGKYIFFLDADDQIMKFALGEYYDLMENTAAQMCFIRFVQEIGQVDKGIKGKYNDIYTGLDALTAFIEVDEDFLYACGAMYERKFLLENDVHYEDLKIGEGGLFILKALMNALRVVVSDYRGYIYRINETSTSHQTYAMSESANGQLNQILFLMKNMTEMPEKRESIIKFLNYYICKNIGGILNLNKADIRIAAPQEWQSYSEFMTKLICGEYIFDDVVLDDAIEAKILQQSKVYLYGAGYDILSAIRYCHQLKVEICGIFVSEIANNSECVYGYKIKKFYADNIEDKSIPFIITARKKHHHKIKKILQEAGIKYIASI